jgi:hypothetical protein
MALLNAGRQGEQTEKTNGKRELRPGASRSVFPNPLLNEVEKTHFIFKQEIDFKPGEIEWSNGAFQVIGAVDAILFRCDQQCRALHAGLSGNALQFERFIGVMILERPAKDNIQAERFQRPPKVFGIAQTAKRGNGLAVEIGATGTRSVVAPAAGKQPCAKNRRARIVDP